MVPRYLDVVDDMPLLTSGKVDRKLLPPPIAVLGRAKHNIVTPTTELERTIAAAWEAIFKQSPISIDDDFFLDLRGHSLFAAQAVTELRQRFPGVSISVPDLYEYRTVRRLAEFLDKSAAARPVGAAEAMAAGARPAAEAQSEMVDAARPPLPRFRWLCVPLQALALIVYYGVITGPVFAAVVLILRVLAGADAARRGHIARHHRRLRCLAELADHQHRMKWLVIGRYKAGHYPVWGTYYFRWWLVTRFQELSLSGIFVGTPLMSLYYRAMGAKVGRNCSIDTPHCFAFDLISIGNDTSIGPESQLLGYRVENGWLMLGTCAIGNECFVGTHACLSLNTRLEQPGAGG